ncbi:MAG: PKD domain-containing protein [Thermoplasmata archaeon]|nr:PKD domain-containing protein [Thermoplasmata archaeon]
MGQLVSFTASASGGTPGYSYAWSFGDGSTNSTLQNPTHAYSAVGTFDPRLTVNDSLGATNSSSLVLVVTAAGPPLAVTLSVTPTSIELGQSSDLSAAATGGNAPYSYTWTLPTGCAAANLSSLACSPTAIGNLSLAVTVHDSAGSTVSRDGYLVVTPAASGSLTVTLAVTPHSVVLGQSSTLTASVSGGSAPYSYAWNLPAGCVSANRSSLTCAPTVAGNLTLAVTVHDSASHSAVQGGYLVATPSGAASPSTAPPSLLPYYLGGAVLLAVSGLLLVILFARRRRSAPPTEPPAGAPPRP